MRTRHCILKGKGVGAKSLGCFKTMAAARAAASRHRSKGARGVRIVRVSSYASR